ncbi:unnamed protein product, partial [Mycena citricolor]
MMSGPFHPVVTHPHTITRSADCLKVGMRHASLYSSFTCPSLLPPVHMPTPIVPSSAAGLGREPSSQSSGACPVCLVPVQLIYLRFVAQFRLQYFGMAFGDLQVLFGGSVAPSGVLSSGVYHCEVDFRPTQSPGTFSISFVRCHMECQMYVNVCRGAC